MSPINSKRTEGYEYWQNATEQIRNYVIASIGLLGASACLAGLVKYRSPQLDLMFSLGGLSSAGMGLIAANSARERQLISQDVQDVSDAARTTALAVAMSPKNLAAQPKYLPESEIKAFDWSELARQRNRYPHLLLLGKTGGGKSTLAEKLAELLGGRVIAVAPHYQRGDYRSAELIVGVGRNYGASALPYSSEPEKGKSQADEPEVDFRDILSGRVRPTVCQFIRAIYNEMTRRYELVDPTSGLPSPDGIYRFVYEGSEVINIILDEYNAYAKLPGIAELFKGLIREARKVGLRLLVLVQGSEVSALGIEGEGSLRESLTYIWLYPFVLDEAKRLLKASKEEQDKAYWNTVIALLQEQEYPILVEDTFAYNPVDLSVQASNDRPNSDLTRPNPLDPVRPQVRQVSNSENLDDTRGSAVDTSVVRQDAGEYKKALWTAARLAANSPNDPMKKSDIIKKVWGFKAERYSSIGIPLWSELTDLYGSIFPDENKDTL